MLTLAGSRLFRLLLSFVARLPRSFGRIALALQARFASLWSSILTFARPIGQSQNFQLHASDVPVVNDNPMGGRPQISAPETVEEEGSGSLAYWQNELSKYQTLILSREFKDPLPATPESGSQRYEPRRVERTRSVEPPDIPAGQKTLLHALPLLPDGWTRHVHPEGNVIFYHKGLHIFTESDILDHGSDILFYATRLIQQAMENDDVILDELAEIVLNVDGAGRWHYYFVDHSNRLLFWVQSVRVREDLGTGLQGINGYSHIRYLVEARYWSHLEYYPNNHTLPEGTFEDLKGMLNHAKTDMITTDFSASPFTQDELTAIEDLINSFKDDNKISNPCSIWVIARLMVFFIEDQFLNFCGQPYARLSIDAPLSEPQTWNYGIVFTLVNWLLLWQPNEYAIRLQRVWVDGMIVQRRWKDFISRFKDDLGQYTLFSTVMLAVNFSFLAIPGVVSSGSSASSIQIIIYCSVVSAVGYIAFTLLLSSVYDDPGFMGAKLAAEVVMTLSRKRWGMACLAITHSLPAASLIWTIVLFFTALAVQIYLPKELPACATLGVEFFILALLGLVSIRVMRRFHRNSGFGDRETFAKDDSAAEQQKDIEQGSTK